jgi:hypothetical protein
MNAKQAKQIPLELILESLGLKPAREDRDERIYFSPLRTEKVPSFSVNVHKNVWHDFGHGGGGNVLDFIMSFYEIPDVSTALKKLEELIGSEPRDIQLPKTLENPVAAEVSSIRPLRILSVKRLKNRRLVQYLHQRGVAWQTALPYVKAIYYQIDYGNQVKTYYALAFPNQSGGYELRNPYFKGSLGRKDISLLPKKKRSEDSTRSGELTVFEGFIDFLSALTFYQVTEALTDVMVLNSVSLKEKGVQTIRQRKVTKVYLYLDRDATGLQLKAHFTKELSPNIVIVDKSDLYAGYKDFNEFLVATPAKNTQTPLSFF